MVVLNGGVAWLGMCVVRSMLGAVSVVEHVWCWDGVGCVHGAGMCVWDDAWCWAETTSSLGKWPSSPRSPRFPDPDQALHTRGHNDPLLRSCGT